MCILLERRGYRLEQIRKLHPAYVEDVLLSADAAEDPKTGAPMFLVNRQNEEAAGDPIEEERNHFRRRGVPEHLLDAEIAKVREAQLAQRRLMEANKK